MADTKVINLKLTPREIGRGEWGKQFYVATFRFPLKEAQEFERRAKSLNLTMSSLLNQLVSTLNTASGFAKAKGIRVERTSQPTIWGKDAKKKFFKAKGMKVPVKVKGGSKPATKKAVVKVEKPKAKKVVVKAKKVQKAEVQSKAAIMLAKLKALKKKNEAA